MSESLSEKVRAQMLEEFQAELDRRVASLDRGEGIDGEEFFAKLREKSRLLRRQKQQDKG